MISKCLNENKPSFLCSGEGATDLGNGKPGALFKLIEQICVVEDKDYVGFCFIEKTVKAPMQLPGKNKDFAFIPDPDLMNQSGKKFGKKAFNLAKLAIINDCDGAILFADCDKTNSNSRNIHQEMVAEITYAFSLFKGFHGIAMIPKHLSEVWLLQALTKKNCIQLETLPSNASSNHNSKEKYKEELKKIYPNLIFEKATYEHIETLSYTDINCQSFTNFLDNFVEKLSHI